MDRRDFLSVTAAGAGVAASRAKAQTIGAPEQIYPGIWKLTLGGAAEKITPTRTRRVAPAVEGLKALPPVDSCPVAASGSATRRGYLVRLPL